MEMNTRVREKKLFKNTLIITIGTICTKLITFLLLPLYTKILSTEEYGTVDLITTLITLMLPIITFQIEKAIFRELIEYRRQIDEQKRIISNGIIITILQCIIYIIIFLLISPLIKYNYKEYLIMNVIANIYSSIFLQIARGLGDNKRYSIASFIIVLFTILFNVLFLLKFNLRVNGMLLGTFLGQLIGIIYLFLSLKLYNFFDFKLFNIRYVKMLWKYSIPLVPNAISWWVFTSSDRIIVSTMLGLSMNGILSAASKFSAMYIILYNIFDTSWTESISEHINDYDLSDYFSKMFNFLIKIFASFALLIIVVMPIVYPILINSNYSSGYGIVPILIAAAFFYVVIGLESVIYVGKKDTKSIAYTSVVSAIVNIFVHLILVKWCGLFAAAISTFVSYFVLAIYRYIDIERKYFNISLDNKIYMNIIIFVIIIIMYYLNNLWTNLISILIVAVYIFIINSREIVLMYNYLTKYLNEYLVKEK